MSSFTTRGMYVSNFLDLVERKGGPGLLKELVETAGMEENYQPLAKYPIENLVHMQELAAPRLFPNKTVDEAMFEFGHNVFSAFASSTFGKIGLNLVGRDLPRLLESVPSFYEAGNQFGEVTLLRDSSGGYQLRFTEYRTYPEYQHGVARAALEALGHPFETKVVIETMETAGEGRVLATFVISLIPASDASG